MSPEFFKEQMGRMYSLFGQKSYPQERLGSIWRYCQGLPNDSFRWIIDRFVDTQKSAPLPSEFKILANAEMDRLGLGRNKEPDTKPFGQAKCYDCGDSGNLFVERKEAFEPWARYPSAVVRCHCPIGRARAKSQGPVWNDDVARSYHKVPVYSFGKGDWRPKPDQSLTHMVEHIKSLPSESRKTRSSELTPLTEIIPLPTKTDPDDPGAA